MLLKEVVRMTDVDVHVVQQFDDGDDLLHWPAKGRSVHLSPNNLPYDHSKTSSYKFSILHAPLHSSGMQVVVARTLSLKQGTNIHPRLAQQPWTDRQSSIINMVAKQM